MCIGIPMQVQQLDEGRAWCRGRNGEAWIDTALVGPLQAGDWLLTFLGAAREVLEESRAHQIDSALTALDAVLLGGADAEHAIDAAFGDLIAREPQLPPHLRKSN